MGRSKYRKGGQYIVTIFWPRGQNIVGVKISSHTVIKLQAALQRGHRKLWQHRLLSKTQKLTSNLPKSHLPVSYFQVARLFLNFAQSTAVILPCSVQNFKMIRQMKWMLWMTEISRDLSLRWVTEGYPISHGDLPQWACIPQSWGRSRQPSWGNFAQGLLNLTSNKGK